MKGERKDSRDKGQHREIMTKCVYVCLCVRAREREREGGEKEVNKIEFWVFWDWIHGMQANTTRVSSRSVCLMASTSHHGACNNDNWWFNYQVLVAPVEWLCVSRLAHHLGPDRNISATNKWIAIKFGTDMHNEDEASWLWWSLVPSWIWHFCSFIKMSQQQIRWNVMKTNIIYIYIYIYIYI